MSMLVLTVGNSYVDIDGYASCIAYRELLKMRGEEAMFVTDALFNYSITNSLLESSYIKDDYTVSEEDTFIVLDLSNKEYFPRFVKEEKIVELIDHHRGFEEYWNSKLGDRAIIESIGAVATIIVEKYEQYNLFQKMDKKIALLLMAAILDNTLNFTADITSDRDIRAYKRLQELTGEIDYADIYFKESQEAILNNIEEAIVNDIKYQKENDKLPRIIGQLTIWDINDLNHSIIRQIMNNKGSNWIINIISLKDNISYIMCSDEAIEKDMILLLNGEQKKGFVVLKPAKLRKEIMVMK